MRHGLEEPGADVVALVSHATQERLKTLLEQVAVIAEHRMEVVKVRTRSAGPHRDVCTWEIGGRLFGVNKYKM